MRSLRPPLYGTSPKICLQAQRLSRYHGLLRKLGRPRGSKHFRGSNPGVLTSAPSSSAAASSSNEVSVWYEHDGSCFSSLGFLYYMKRCEILIETWKGSVLGRNPAKLLCVDDLGTMLWSMLELVLPPILISSIIIKWGFCLVYEHDVSCLSSLGFLSYKELWDIDRNMEGSSALVLPPIQSFCRILPSSSLSHSSTLSCGTFRMRFVWILSAPSNHERYRTHFTLFSMFFNASASKISKREQHHHHHHHHHQMRFLSGAKKKKKKILLPRTLSFRPPFTQVEFVNLGGMLVSRGRFWNSHAKVARQVLH